MLKPDGKAMERMMKVNEKSGVEQTKDMVKELSINATSLTRPPGTVDFKA